MNKWSVFFVCYLIVIVLAIIGWIVNLIAVIQLAMAGGAITIMLILRIVGIFVAPLGAVLGYVW